MDDKQAAELLNKISAGEEAALAEFYRLFENRLFRFIQTKLNDPFEAADILNEVFLDVWRKASSFEGRSKVSTWLFSIANYKTMDRLRKNKPEALDDEQLHQIEDDSVDQLSELVIEEDAGKVKFCLETLKEAHRTVMELAFFNDLSYREIAEIVICPENTVKTRVFHAKEAMKRCLLKRAGYSAS